MSITVYESEQEQNFLTFWEPVKETLLNSVSALTGLSYGPSVDEFLQWWLRSGTNNPIAAVTGYRKYLSEDMKLKPATVNKKLSSIRRLFEVAATLGIGKTGWPFNHEVSIAIKNIRNIPQHGDVYGTRLSKSQLEILCFAPDPTTALGLRDRAVLGLLVGCGLRRSEVCNLTWGQIRRDGELFVIADIRGKHGRIRTVNLPAWVYKMLVEYCIEPWDKDARIIQSYDRHGNKRGKITTQTIYRIVTEYSTLCGFGVAPHDLRRSHALVSRLGGASIETVRDDLGHSSSVVTEKYIGKRGDLGEMAEMWDDFGEDNE
jgi:integrase